MRSRGASEREHFASSYFYSLSTPPPHGTLSCVPVYMDKRKDLEHILLCQKSTLSDEDNG